MIDLQHCIDSRPTWDELFFTQTYLWALRSIDPSSQVGCVITTQDNVVISAGYNGPVRGSDLTDPVLQKALITRPDKYAFMEHGERNAIYNALRVGRSVVGGKLYVNGLPCADCCRAICQAGITCVKVHKEGDDIWKVNPAWKDGYERVMSIFSSAGVKVEVCDVCLLFPITIRLNGQRITMGDVL